MGPFEAGLLGIGLGLWDDVRQRWQQQRLTDSQVEAQKNLMKFSAQLAYDMWQKTNYSAQVEQLHKAGLNPGLLYGMGGAGGATAIAPSGSASGGTAASRTGDIQAMVGMGMQLELLQSQKRLLEAQAEKAEAEAAKTRGVDTEEAHTRIAELWQNIDNKRWANSIQQVELRLKHMEAHKQEATLDDVIDSIIWNAQQAKHQLDIARYEAGMQRDTYNDKVNIVRQQAIASTLNNILIRSNIDVNKAQIDKWAKELSIAADSLELDKQKVAIEKFKAEIQAAYPGIMQTAGRLINDGITRIFESVRGSRPRLEKP